MKIAGLRGDSFLYNAVCQYEMAFISTCIYRPLISLIRQSGTCKQLVKRIKIFHHPYQIAFDYNRIEIFEFE
jgi:hypothetical protein